MIRTYCIVLLLSSCHIVAACVHSTISRIPLDAFWYTRVFYPLLSNILPQRPQRSVLRWTANHSEFLPGRPLPSAGYRSRQRRAGAVDKTMILAINRVVYVLKCVFCYKFCSLKRRGNSVFFEIFLSVSVTKLLMCGYMFKIYQAFLH